MRRGILLLAVLTAACAHRELRALDGVTTTAAIYDGSRARASRVDLEDALEASPDVEARPSPLPKATPDDARIAAYFEQAAGAAAWRADHAAAHAKNPNVVALARSVHESMREARLALDRLVPAPEVAPEDQELAALAGQSRVDFDRAWVARARRDTAAMLGALDQLVPGVEEPRLKNRLMALRPMLDQLYAAEMALEQSL